MDTRADYCAELNALIANSETIIAIVEIANFVYVPCIVSQSSAFAMVHRLLEIDNDAKPTYKVLDKTLFLGPYWEII
jgi:hypothetical protein